MVKDGSVTQTNKQTNKLLFPLSILKEDKLMLLKSIRQALNHRVRRGD